MGLLDMDRQAELAQMAKDAERSSHGLLNDSMIPTSLYGSLMQDPADKERMDRQMLESTLAMMPMAGSTFYHASPNRFQQFSDKFNLEGEGFNAYTKGLYSAENLDKVAMDYLREFANRGKEWVYSSKVQKKYMPEIKKLNKIIDSQRHEQGYTNLDLDKLAKLQLHRDSLVKKMQEEGGKQIKSKSFLYDVDIPAGRKAQMLNWDKPILEQKGLLDKIDPERILTDKAIKWRTNRPGTPIEHRLYPERYEVDVTGEDFIKYLQRNKKMKGRFGLEKWLKSKGVPGIQYFDAGSRPTVTNWKPKKQTQNIVAYHPEDMTIKRMREFDPILGLPK